jgi:hypothetical protein
VADPPTGPEQPRWLQKPLDTGEVRINIAIDEEAELTPELRGAIEDVVRALQDQEVQGYAVPQGGGCNGLSSCTPHNCPRVRNCDPLVVAPCANYESCRITYPPPP